MSCKEFTKRLAVVADLLTFPWMPLLNYWSHYGRSHLVASVPLGSIGAIGATMCWTIGSTWWHWRHYVPNSRVSIWLQILFPTFLKSRSTTPQFQWSEIILDLYTKANERTIGYGCLWSDSQPDYQGSLLDLAACFSYCLMPDVPYSRHPQSMSLKGQTSYMWMIMKVF